MLDGFFTKRTPSGIPITTKHMFDPDYHIIDTVYGEGNTPKQAFDDLDENAHDRQKWDAWLNALSDAKCYQKTPKPGYIAPTIYVAEAKEVHLHTKKTA